MSPAWAQVTTFDGVYDTVGKADPQNPINCNQNVPSYPIKVTNGTFNGPDRNPVTIGPNGAAEANGRYLISSQVTAPFSATYHFANNAMDSDFTFDLVRGGGKCIYHRHGTKRS